MASIAELRDRARKMFQDIKTPWAYPRFPDPPKEFLPPQQFLDLVSETVLVHHTKINHPFCVKLVRGEWSLKQLRAWAIKALPVVRKHRETIGTLNAP